MVYYRRRRRRTYKRRPKKQPTTRTVTRIVKKELSKSVEKKFVLSEFTGAISDNINFNRLNTPGNGTADNERVGDTIYLKSIYYNYSFIVDDGTNLVRFMIIQWLNDSSHNPPVGSSILEGSSTIPVQAPYSMNNSQNYRILYDKTHTLSDTGANRVIQRRGYITKIPCRKVVFTNNDANAANVKKGQIYLVQVSDSVLSGPDLSVVCKLNYTDG